MSDPDPIGRGEHLVVLTGAGCSADSGVPTFRDAGGLWEGHRPEDVATPDAWAADPELVWRFYQQRRAALRTVEPNAAHRALYELECEAGSLGARVTLVTQNVDDLHQRAGSEPICMHGSLSMLCCESCGHRLRDLEHTEPDEPIPCPACGRPRLRPDVVWFGEVPHHLDEIWDAVGSASRFLALGTSGVVYPAAGLLEVARERGTRTLVQSLDAPENLHPADDFYPGRAAEVVPRLVARLLGREPSTR